MTVFDGIEKSVGLCNESFIMSVGIGRDKGVWDKGVLARPTMQCPLFALFDPAGLMYLQRLRYCQR